MTSVTVELFSRRIPIRTDDSVEHIQSLVELIEGKMNEIDSNHRLPEMTLAILTLLNLADDLVKEKQLRKDLRSSVQARSTFLLEKLHQNGYLS